MKCFKVSDQTVNGFFSVLADQALSCRGTGDIVKDYRTPRADVPATRTEGLNSFIPQLQGNQSRLQYSFGRVRTG